MSAGCPWFRSLLRCMVFEPLFRIDCGAETLITYNYIYKAACHGFFQPGGGSQLGGCRPSSLLDLRIFSTSIRCITRDGQIIPQAQNPYKNNSALKDRKKQQCSEGNRLNFANRFCGLQIIRRITELLMVLDLKLARRDIVPLPCTVTGAINASNACASGSNPWGPCFSCAKAAARRRTMVRPSGH